MASSITPNVSQAPDIRDELFCCYELPATWALLRALSPPSSKLPDMDDMVQALRHPQSFEDAIAGLHGRALAIAPNVAKNEWIFRTRELAVAHPSEFRLIFGAFSIENEEDDDDEEGASVSDMEFAPLKSAAAYRALSAEQRLRILHTVAELTVQNPKSCARLTSRPADEIRLGCFGHDSAGNDYFYFGDKQKLFREPGRLPRMKSFAPSLNYVEEEKKRKEREKKRKEAEAERRKQIKLQLEEEKRKRNAERKLAAEIRKREKEERARKREAEKERKAREMRAKWAPRHPDAVVTRNSKRLKAELMEIDKREAELAEQSTKKPKKEEDVVVISDTENDAGTANGKTLVDSVEEKAPVGNTKAVKRQSALDSFLQPKNINLSTTQVSVNQNFADSIHADEGAVSTGGTLASENSDVELCVDTKDPRLRSCAGWELVADGFCELRAFVSRFGDPSKIKNSEERALMYRIRNVLLPEFEEEEATRARKIQKRARMEKLAVGAKKSRRLQEIDERKAQEAEEARKLERRQRMRKKQRTR